MGNANALSASNKEEAELDNDGDGISNLNEFLSGTDPAKSDESPHLTHLERSGRDMLVNLSAQDGRLYGLERNPRLAKTGWILVRDEVQCTNGVATVTHTNAAGPLQFYRVLIRP